MGISFDNLSGILLSFYVNGSRTGKLKIIWGMVHTETYIVGDKAALQLGRNEIGYALPLGTHQICVTVV